MSKRKRAERRDRPRVGANKLLGAEDRVTANVALAGRFIASIFDDPDVLDEIPEGASVIVLPDDDPRVAAANREGGLRLRATGKPVRVFRLAALPRTRRRVAVAGGRPSIGRTPRDRFLDQREPALPR